MRGSVAFLAFLAVAGCSSASRDPEPVVILEPDAGDHLWFFHESAEELGSGGALQIYVDPETHPDAGASFAKFTLGVGGALPVHRHEKTEEFAYFLEGEGIAVTLDENGERVEVPVAAHYVWYNPPGAWHAIENTGAGPLTLVFATVPNEKHGLMSFFRRIGVEPGKAGTPLAPEEFERLASEHDLILRGATD